MNEPALPGHLDHMAALATALSAMRNAVLLIAPGRRPAYANDTFLELSGYSYDELLSLERTSAISADHDEPKTTAMLNQALQGEPTTFRLRPLVRRDQSEIWVEGALTPISLEGDRYLLAEFRPTCHIPTDGTNAWNHH